MKALRYVCKPRQLRLCEISLELGTSCWQPAGFLTVRMDTKRIPPSGHLRHPPPRHTTHCRSTSQVKFLLAFQRKLPRNYSHLYLLPAHTGKSLQDWVQFLKAVLWRANPSSAPSLLCEFMLFSLTHLRFSLYQINSPIPLEMPLFSPQYLLRRMEWIHRKIMVGMGKHT